MGLGVLIRIGGVLHYPGVRVDEGVALGRTFDTVCPVQACVEPLGAVRCRTLTRNQVAHLIEVGAGISLACEVAVLPPPVGPGPCESTEEPPPIDLPTHSFVRLKSLKLLVVRRTSLEPDRHTILRYLPEGSGNAGLAQVLLGADFSCNPIEPRRQFHAFDGIGHRTVRVPDLHIHLNPVEDIKRIVSGCGEAALDDHPGLGFLGFENAFASGLHRAFLLRDYRPG